MARGTRTVYLGKRNKELSSTFQPPEEGQGVQRQKSCDKHGDKDEDHSSKHVNNEHNASFQKYWEIVFYFILRFIDGIFAHTYQTKTKN